MKLKELFRGRPSASTGSAEADAVEPRPEHALDLDDLDGCVGGHLEVEGVGCYVHSTQPNVH